MNSASFDRREVARSLTSRTDASKHETRVRQHSYRADCHLHQRTYRVTFCNSSNTQGAITASNLSHAEQVRIERNQHMRILSGTCACMVCTSLLSRCARRYHAFHSRFICTHARKRQGVSARVQTPPSGHTTLRRPALTPCAGTHVPRIAQRSRSQETRKTHAPFTPNSSALIRQAPEKEVECKH